MKNKKLYGSVVKSKTLVEHKAKTYTLISKYNDVAFISFRTIILHHIDSYVFNKRELIIRQTKNYVLSELVYALQMDTYNKVLGGLERFKDEKQ